MKHNWVWAFIWAFIAYAGARDWHVVWAKGLFVGAIAMWVLCMISEATKRP